MGSVSVISEAIHSGLDLVAALIAYLSLKRHNRLMNYISTDMEKLKISPG